jgi:hypothetical protein
MAVGTHPKVLRAQLGHASITVTPNTHGDLVPDAFADVGPALDRLAATTRGPSDAGDVALVR